MYHPGVARSAKHYAENSIERTKNSVLLARDGIEYVIIFSGSERDTQRVSVLLSGFSGANAVEEVRAKLKEKISSLQPAGVTRIPESDSFAGREEFVRLRDYYNLFGNNSPKVSEGQEDYKSNSYTGVLASFPIAHIPLGDHGGVSEKLFTLIDAEILQPIRQAAEELQKNSI